MPWFKIFKKKEKKPEKKQAEKKEETPMDRRERILNRVKALDKYFETGESGFYRLSTYLGVRSTRIPRGYKVVERYPLNEPWAYAVIVYNPETGDYRYIVEENRLNEIEKYYYSLLTKILIRELEPPGETVKDVYKYYMEKADQIVNMFKMRLGITAVGWNKIAYYIKRDMMGFGVIDPLMRDPYVEDISCNGVGRPVYVWHRKYESLPTNIVFEDEETLANFVVKLVHMAGAHISVAYPIVDAILPGGHRLACTYKREVSVKGSSFTIRKFRENPITIVEMLSRFKTLDYRVAGYFWLLMEEKQSGMILGVTGAGKTTTLNAIATLVKPTIKVVTIEDTPEIRLPLENWVQLVTRTAYGGSKASEVTMFDLVKVSLRYRPDIIIVGEVRGEEARVLMQAVASVSPDTMVAIRDRETGIPRLVKIGWFVDKYYREGEERIAKNVDGYDVLTINKSGRIGWRKIKYVLRHSTGEIYRIDYTGGTVYATGSHSVFVVDKDTGEIVEKPVSLLEKGDLLVTFVKSIIYDKPYKKIDLIDLLEKEVNVYAETPSGKLISLVEARRHKDCLIRLWNSRKVYLPRYLELDEHLAYILGLYYRHGYVIRGKRGTTGRIRFTISREAYEKFREIFENKFRVKAKIIGETEDTVRIEVFSSLLSRLFNNLFSDRDRVLGMVMDSGFAVVRAFMLGVMNTGIDSEECSRCIRLDDLEEAEKIAWIGRLAGFYTRINKIRVYGKTYYEVCIFDSFPSKIPVNALLRLVRMAGLRLPREYRYIEKRETVTKTVAKAVLDYVARYGELTETARQLYKNLMTLVYGDVGTVVVKKVEKQPYKGYVYDISVEDTEAFFGGTTPVLLHNTGHGGLCLPRDQLIPAMVNGKTDLYEIGDVVEGILSGKYKDVKVLSYRNGRPVWINVRKAIMMTGTNRFLRIRLEGGVEHEVHEDHPVLVYEDGRLVTKKAKELEVGDVLVSIKKLDVEEKIREINVAEKLSRYKDVEDDAWNVSKISLDKDFGYVLGYFLARGSVETRGENTGITFYADREAHAVKLVDKLKHIGVSGNALKMEKHGDMYIVYVGSKKFALLIRELLEGRIDKHSRALPVELILYTPQAFREGIAEGYMDSGASSVVNRKLAETIVLLLKTLGVETSVVMTEDNKYRIQVVGNGEKLGKHDNLALHKVVGVEEVYKDSLLYDFETEEPHIFAVSGGLVLTHNCTLHADGVDTAVKRLMGEPMNVPETYIPLIKFMALVKRISIRTADGKLRTIRRMTNVWEIRGVNDYIEISRWNARDDSFAFQPEKSKVLREVAEFHGKDLDWAIQEIHRRATVLLACPVRREIDYRSFARRVALYYANPDKVYKESLEILKNNGIDPSAFGIETK